MAPDDCDSLTHIRRKQAIDTFVHDEPEPVPSLPLGQPMVVEL